MLAEGQTLLDPHHSSVPGTAVVPYVLTGKFSKLLMHYEPGPPSDESVTLAFTGHFPGSPGVKTVFPTQGTRVGSLVGELSSFTLSYISKEHKKQANKKLHS